MALPFLMPEDVFAERYRIVRAIAGGGTPVYEAVRLTPERSVALQLVEVNDQADVPAVMSAAQAAMRNTSEHVVPILDAGIADGVLWIESEWSAGEDLGARLERAGHLGQTEGTILLKQLAGALASIHARGAIHGDLRPEKIMIADELDGPHVRLLGVGVSAAIGGRQRDLTSSKLGDPERSPLHTAAPERLKGKGEAGAGADVWALGLIAFRMFTGRSYWTGSAPIELVGEIVYGPTPHASERARELGVTHTLPVWFDAWFVRCLQRDEGGRFADAREAEREIGGPVELDPVPIMANPKGSHYDAGLADHFRDHEANDGDGKGYRAHIHRTPLPPPPERERKREHVVMGNPKGALYDARQTVRRSKVPLLFALLAVAGVAAYWFLIRR